MKRNKLLLTALAVILAMGVMIAPALAYFTAHVEAQGGATLELGYMTTITEDPPTIDTKVITISNEGPESCYVRVKAIASDGIKLTGSGSGWSQDGDWWVYATPIDAGKSTEKLTLTIGNVPAGTDGDYVEIAVVHEATKAIYNEDGTPQAPDWNLKPEGE